MYTDELKLTSKMLAIISNKGYNEIPFRNECFRNGIRKTKQYIENNITECYPEEMPKMLFINNGEEFAERIMDFIGLDYLYMDSANLDSVIIDIDDDIKEKILNDTDLMITETYLSNIADSFLEGCGLL